MGSNAFIPFSRANTAEISEDTITDCLGKKWLTILRAEDNTVMQRGVRVRHECQPSLRDALL